MAANFEKGQAEPLQNFLLVVLLTVFIFSNGTVEHSNSTAQHSYVTVKYCSKAKANT